MAGTWETLDHPRGFFRSSTSTPPQRIQQLTRPPAPEFTSSEALKAFNERAKLILAGQGTIGNNIHAPERQLRPRFSVFRLKDSAKKDSAKGSVTKHDVAVVFNNLVYQSPLPPPALAQAVLNHASATSIDELWHLLGDAAGPRGRSAPFTIDKTQWLDVVTRWESLDYIRLICHRGISQRGLDEALSLALSKNSYPTIELLLRYGACASSCKDLIRDRFKSDNVRLARLLLAAPSSMSSQEWQYCLDSRASSAPSVLALCLDCYPHLTSAQMLLEAVGSANIPAIAIMLRDMRAADDIRNVGVEACRRAHVIESDDNRRAVFMMLAQAGLIRDTAFLQKELARAVRLRQSGLIRALVSAGVSLNANANNVLGNAIAGMAFDILESFASEDSSPILAPVLDYVPISTSEQDILRLLYIFRDNMGEPCDPLHRQLIRAVQARRINLVHRLLDCGAAVDFQGSEAVKETIRRIDVELLKILLNAECSENIISEAIPTAMTLEGRPYRLEVMRCLLDTGRAPPQTLAESLRQLTCAPGEADLELIQLLLKRKAPLDWYSDDARNCILVCTRKGDLPLLQVLCAAGPQVKTLSQAVPVAFRVSLESNYQIALSIMAELLNRGAEGPLLHKTLLDAARQDKQLKFVRLLLRYRGDANYESGASYTAAIENQNDDLLQMLCKACPPTRATLENALPKTIDPRRYRRNTLQLLLSSAAPEIAAVALKNCWAVAKLKDNPHFASIIPCFLKHGLDVNVDNGFLVSFAIQKQNGDLLTNTLSAGPNIATLISGLNTAAALPASVFVLNMMDSVLSRAGSAEIGQSKLLPRQTRAAVCGNSVGLKILLRHRADVDFNSGSAVQIAAEAGCLEVLDQLLERKPAWGSINAGCHIVSNSSLEPMQKQTIFERLLDAPADKSPTNISQLLASSLAKCPNCTQLPTLLLSRGAEPDLETCQIALEKISVDRCLTLFQYIQKKDAASSLFKHLAKTSISIPERSRIYECLLSKGIPSKDVSAAFLHYLKVDGAEHFKLLELLLKHGADVGHKEGVAFRRGPLGSDSVNRFKLLARYIKDDNTASIAFDTARKAAFSQNERIAIYRDLLMKWNIRGPVIQDALVLLLKNGRCDPVVLQMLLRNGADPNKDGAQCFILACASNAESEFRTLSSKAEMAVVVKALMAHFRAEPQVVWWLNICLEGRPALTKLEDGSLLFQCLRTFPKGTALLKLLLSKGVPASATTLHSISEGWPPEQCTALIWALSSKPKVDNEVIRTLLDRGGIAALPSYSTPAKEVSAAFLCMLDRSRTSILKALIRLDEDQVLSYHVLGASFEHLAIAPAVLDPASSEFPVRLPLHLAALFLGNFDAFRLLNQNRSPNEGLLHNAAFFALPEFVEWLLRTDDPNAREESFDGRIPLAVACDARYMQCCKMGNEKDFRTRQRETIKKLVARTDPTYHEKHMTLLHIALHRGPETTAMMLEALNVAADSNRATKYRYTDQGGRQYSPRDYVTEIMGCEQEQKKALLACLSNAGFNAVPGSWL